MVKEHPLSSRNRAIGMLEAGLTQKKCAKIIGADISTVRRWWCRYKKGESLQNKGGRGPKSSIPRVVKIILAKSISKRNQSTRKLAKRITASGFPITHGTVHSYLRKNLHVKGARILEKYINITTFYCFIVTACDS